MRVLAGLGVVLFAYLALIALGAVISTVDPGCEGCADSIPVIVLLTGVYGLCLLALTATAIFLAVYALSPETTGAERIVTALAASAAAAGIALAALFTVSFPLAGGVIAALGVAIYLWLRSRPGPGDPAGNGHRPLD